MSLTTSFVGRRREIRELAALADSARLVTVTGPGGSGKSRLAREVATRKGDAAFAELAGTGLDGVADAVAAALGENGFDSLDELACVVGDRPGLLVIDNFEHVLAAARRWPASSRRAPACTCS